MEIKDLVENLIAQKNNLTLLHKSAVRKQKALVQLNYEDLEASISAEEKAIVQIQQSEKTRIKILSDIYSGNSIKNNSPKISEFVEKAKNLLDRQTAEKLLLLEKEIKEVIKQISSVNHQNKYLIENSRAFIKETITSLINTNKSFLDRKV